MISRDLLPYSIWHELLSLYKKKVSKGQITKWDKRFVQVNVLFSVPSIRDMVILSMLCTYFLYSALDCLFLKTYVKCICRENTCQTAVFTFMYRHKFQRLSRQEGLQSAQKVCINLHLGIVNRVKWYILNLVQKSAVRITQLLCGGKKSRDAVFC